jgi:hypothetical protein
MVLRNQSFHRGIPKLKKKGDRHKKAASQITFFLTSCRMLFSPRTIWWVVCATSLEAFSKPGIGLKIFSGPQDCIDPSGAVGVF